ncbi:Carbonic anhydrase [Mycena sanguinolenta]|uniref:Carbonic anhydrase n=1 Tax=Mycena sanguinolenta TaxID=230812 RepID=A0A8H6Y7J4_9AGAR|nr:Carbonic anhydrase [Mycena sanguinolenta]
MSPQHTEFVQRNEPYVANFGDKEWNKNWTFELHAWTPDLTYLGIKEGDAHVIRNAGGVSKDEIRSIILSQRLLGTREIAVFHHTDCGMLAFTSDYGMQTWLHVLTPSTFLEFKNLEESVKEDVAWLKNEPLVLPETTVTGWIYDVKSGKVSQVV